MSKIAKTFGAFVRALVLVVLVVGATSLDLTNPEPSGASTTTVPLCTAAQLNGVGGRQGESMGSAGLLVLVNVSSTSCRLVGAPRLTLVVQGASGRPTIIMASGRPSHPVRAVDVQRHEEAVLTTYWGNWCKPTPGPLQVVVTLATAPHQSLTVGFNGPPDYNASPQCVKKSATSFFEISSGFNVVVGSLPDCVMTNLTASLVRGSAAAGTGYLQMSLVNHGPVCDLMRVEARAYDPAKEAFVGPWAKYFPVNGVDQHRRRVGILAENARANVTMGVETAQNYPATKCALATTPDIRLAEFGSLSRSLQLALYGPTQVCTKFPTLFMQWPSIG